MKLDRFSQPWVESFPGDDEINLRQRQTPKQLYAKTKNAKAPNPELIHFNKDLGEELNWDYPNNQEEIAFLSGTTPNDFSTYATAYAGHQFGHWAGQLGDGRAIFAGEIQDKNNSPIEIQWKGAGATPYSRRGDGRAVLRSSIREYLMSEAIYHLGIPTTRALSLTKTGEKVARDIMYSGHIEMEDGAVVVRTAPSFIRFGHFQFLQMHQDIPLLKKLADFTIERYFASILENNSGENKYLAFYKKVVEKTQDMIIGWYRVGFTHGVMNTDNMSILGLSIDYGPFGFLDEFDFDFTPNTTDLPGRRYAFGKQASIAHWNLAALGNALLPLFNNENELQEIIDGFEDQFWQKFDVMMAKKFGFKTKNQRIDQFTRDAMSFLNKAGYDYTLFYKALENSIEDVNSSHFKLADYQQGEFNSDLEKILKAYKILLQEENILEEERIKLMQENNPWFIPRNYILFNCIEEVKQGKMDLFNKIFKALKNPYDNVYPELNQPKPSWAADKPGCSMLSCSS